MLILKKITLKNFISHSNTVIEFKEGQKLLIDGKSGSGKSSIVEALVWCWYGKGRSDNRGLIKGGKPSAKVIVESFDNESGYSFKVERSITKSNKHAINISESSDGGKFIPVKATGVKGVQEYLEKTILKSSYLLFINSIVYLQENVETFVRQTAAKRKDIILEIINSDNYDDYLKRSKTAIQEIKLSLGIAESKIEEKEKQIKDDEAKSANLDIYKGKKVEIVKELAEVRLELEKVQEENDLISEKLSYIKGKEEAVIDIINRISAHDLKLKEINDKIIALQTVDIEALKNDVAEKRKVEESIKLELSKKTNAVTWQEKMNEVTRLLPIEHDYDSDIKVINTKMINVFGEKIPECHKCGAKYLEFENSKNKRIKELEEDLSILSVKKKEYNDKREAYKNGAEAIGFRPEYSQDKINTYDNVKKGLEESERKLNELAGSVEVIKQLELDIGSVNKEKEELNIKKETTSKEIEGKSLLEEQNTAIRLKRSNLIGKEQTLIGQNTENESSLAIAEDAYNNISKNKKDIEELKSGLTTIKNDSKSLEAIKDAFSPNGIKAIVIDYVIPQLEDKINDVLGKLSDFRVRLETQKSGATEGTLLEGLFITVINDVGEEFQFDSFSGGEKVKISLSINEALASASNINFRIFDESVVALDNESTEQFLDAMNGIQKRVNQIACISHMQEIKDSFNEKIIIEKKNGNSSIR